MRAVPLVVDTSAVLGYAAGRAGVIDLLASLDHAPFGVPLLSMCRALNTPAAAAQALVIDVDRIADHPGFVALPVPTGLDKLRTAYERIFAPRQDLVAALLTAHLNDCPIGTYELDNYVMDGIRYGDVFQIEDRW